MPPFWGQDERQALIDSADLAGLKVLSLMNENTAVAMKYAIDRKFEKTKEHNVIFYDMGSASVKSSLVTFSAYDILDGNKNKTIESFEVKVGAAADRPTDRPTDRLNDRTTERPTERLADQPN